jgi:cytoskeletal protein RodZ
LTNQKGMLYNSTYMKKLSVVTLVSLAGLLMFNNVVFAHNNKDDHSCDDNNYSHYSQDKDDHSHDHDDEDCKDDNDHNHSGHVTPEPWPTPTPTPKPTHKPTPTPTPSCTPTPSAAPIATSSATPTATPIPTLTPTATPVPTPVDVCANIAGIQTKVPDTYHLAGNNCLQWELGGAPEPPSTNSKGQVLGTSTSVLADTASPLIFPRAIIGIIGAAISFVFSKRIIA